MAERLNQPGSYPFSPEIGRPDRGAQNAHAFLDAWGDKALELGWSADGLFDPPAQRGCQGLVWCLEHRRGVALTDRLAVMDGAVFARPLAEQAQP